METAKLKKFAQAARTDLIRQVGAKLALVLSPDSAARREHPGAIAELERQLRGSSREQLVDKVAYTWFNRFVALRFMDVNGYIRIRVVSPTDEGQVQPEILAEAKMGHLDEERIHSRARDQVRALLDGAAPSRDPQQEAYRLLLVAECNSFHRVMPFLFERIADYSELLMPDDLLSANSILADIRAALTPEACRDVEVLGWLYQFYIAEKKDEVMARKSAVPTADIPAVTQLFTPHWIVRYLVENSLGRLWLLNRPGSKLRQHMPYYIEGEAETDFLTISTPEEIRLIDNACGSGHMLTYAFDLLYLIYEEEGYPPTAIPGLILRHNLYGLDICPRAAQLAGLALVLKARAKSRRFFQPEHLVRPHIIELRDVRFADNELRDYSQAFGLGDLLQQPMLRLLHQFEEAKNFGSLIQPCLDEQAIATARRAIETKDVENQLFLRETHLKVLRVLEQAEALTQRYHVVVANPPFMGARDHNKSLHAFLRQEYEGFDKNLFSAFIKRAQTLSLGSAYIAYLTPFVWLTIATYEDLRIEILRKLTIINLVKPSYTAFFEMATVQFVAFVLRNSHSRFKARYFDLGYLGGANEQPSRLKVLIEKPDAVGAYERYSDEFLQLPGYPIAFSISQNLAIAFVKNSPLKAHVDIRQGLATGSNGLFVRFWTEVNFAKIGLNYDSVEQTKDRSHKWFPYNKGGDYRKWYGNAENIVNWENDGEEIRRFGQETGKIRSRAQNALYYFKPSATWSTISSFSFGVRACRKGFIFDVGGSSAFPTQKDSQLTVGFLCSKLATIFMQALNPTVNMQVGNVAELPFLREVLAAYQPKISSIVDQAVQIATADWDNFETSWDFRDPPLLRPGLKGATLKASWRNWEAHCTAAIRRMQELETENNRLFIAAYGLEGELQPEVPEAQITLARAEARRDMADFLSYAVGCLFGRYSLDKPGLILANQGDTLADYLRQVPEPRFMPDADNVIPLLDGDWFPDDVTERCRRFLRVTFGEEHYADNLAFIEAVLGKDLRKYFIRDFYADHVKRYKKRPIYWLFTSPKGTFNALIYLHRYRPDTVSIVLQYLRDFRQKLAARLDQLQHLVIGTAASQGEKTRANKAIDIIKKQLLELEDYERDTLYPLATEQIALDLDDGVKVNYLKVGPALKKIVGLEAKGED